MLYDMAQVMETFVYVFLERVYTENLNKKFKYNSYL